jgi:hypothetical protein
LLAADAEKALLRTIAAQSATFVLLNILYLLVELRGITQNGLTLAANTGETVKFRRQIKLMCKREAPHRNPPRLVFAEQLGG